MPQSEVFAQAALAPPGSEGALFLPTLSGAWAPRWNGRMRGSFAGLGLHHDRTHLARAILEGCAFALRDIVDRFEAMGLGGEELRVVGGGARSALWLQIKADVTGHPVRAVRGDHATSAGRRDAGRRRRRASSPTWTRPPRGPCGWPTSRCVRARTRRRSTRRPTAPIAACSMA